METAYERVMRYASEAIDNGRHATAVLMLRKMREALVFCNASAKRIIELNTRMGVDDDTQDELRRECARREFKIGEINGRLEHLGA